MGPVTRETPDPEGDTGRGATLRQTPSSGDQLLTALYREYAGSLRAYVLRLTGGDLHWAEDVVQETMLRAWRNADDLDGEAASLMPWLATVARRIVIDDRRRRSSRPPETSQEQMEDFAGPDTTEQADRRLVLSMAMQRLSPEHRQALTETVLADRTVNQAARFLGLPVGTVKSRIYYALRNLRDDLDPGGLGGHFF